MKRHLTSIGLLFIWIFFASTAYAIDSVSLEGGTGNRSQLIRLAAQWHWPAQWWQWKGMHMSGYWDVSLAKIFERKYRDIQGAYLSLTDIGLTPVFRIQANSRQGLYLEAGIGVHLMSHLYHNNGRHFSTAFEFGDHIGVGYVFVYGHGLDVGISLQHFSNAGIKHPNPGVEFVVLRVNYHF